MTIAETNFTPGQLYAVVGVLVFLFAGVLLARKVFAYATVSDLEKLEKSIALEMEKHQIKRHEMRHEITRVEVAIAKIQTQVMTNTDSLKSIDAKVECLPEKIIARLKDKN